MIHLISRYGFVFCLISNIRVFKEVEALTFEFFNSLRHLPNFFLQLWTNAYFLGEKLRISYISLYFMSCLEALEEGLSRLVKNAFFTTVSMSQIGCDRIYFQLNLNTAMHRKSRNCVQFFFALFYCPPKSLSLHLHNLFSPLNLNVGRNLNKICAGRPK